VCVSELTLQVVVWVLKALCLSNDTLIHGLHPNVTAQVHVERRLWQCLLVSDAHSAACDLFQSQQHSCSTAPAKSLCRDTSHRASHNSCRNQ
jgi:hypothetical protein